MEDRAIAGNRWNLAREVASGWIGRNRSGAERKLAAVAGERDATADTAGARDDSGSGDGSALCVSGTDAGSVRDGYGLRLHVAGDRCRPSILRVTVGWVDLQHGFRQSLVPAGAAAESRPGIGPGAPYFQDSSERFQDALQTVNFDVEDSQARADALTVLLAEARTRDAFTLLNLFRRVDAQDRGRLYDRLAVLLPPPAGVTRQNAVDGDDMSAWWDKLGLGHAKKGLKGPPRVEE